MLPHSLEYFNKIILSNNYLIKGKFWYNGKMKKWKNEKIIIIITMNRLWPDL